MKVYRISHRNHPHMGFYHTLSEQFSSASGTYQAFNDYLHHPSPEHDISDRVVYEWWLSYPMRSLYYFGFHYKHQLCRWVKKGDKDAIKRVASNPFFMIREYSSDNVKLFDNQCVFFLDTAKLIREYHFSEVFG